MFTPLLSLLQLTFDFGASPDVVATSNAFFLQIMKFFFILGAFMYVIFAFIVIRQIKIMRTTLITTFSPVVTTFGYLHFALAVFVLLLFFLIL